MPIKGKLNNKTDTIQFGGSLSSAQKEALQKASPTASQILQNLDGLNEEIIESHAQGESSVASIDPFTQPPQAPIAPAAPTWEINTMEDFDSALDKMQADLAATPKPSSDAAEAVSEEVAETPDERMRRQILELLGDAPNAPDERQIAAWKQQFGKNGIYVTALGDGDVYVYTHLRRSQWQKLQQTMQMAAEKEVVQDIEERLKEHVLTQCVLYPKPLTVEFFYNSRAGVVDSIYQAILMNSYFLNAQQVMMLTTQL